MEQDKKIVIDKLTPTGFRVLVNIWKKPTTTSSGFVLPENENQGMPVMACISVLGKKTWVQHLQIFFGLKPKYKLGQWVYFRKYSVDELRITSESGELLLYVLEEGEIIGVVQTV